MGLCSLRCPLFPLDVVKGTLLFMLVGHDLCHALCLKHRALGDPMEILGSGSNLLSWERSAPTGEAVFFTDQLSQASLHLRPGLTSVGTG